MVKTGVFYETNRGYSVALFNSYFGGPTQIVDINSTTLEVNPRAESYNLLTGNILLDVRNLLEITNMPDTTFSLYLDNLLGEDIFFPSINRQAVNSLPHHAGRGIYSTISVKF